MSQEKIQIPNVENNVNSASSVQPQSVVTKVKSDFNYSGIVGFVLSALSILGIHLSLLTDRFLSFVDKFLKAGEFFRLSDLLNGIDILILILIFAGFVFSLIGALSKKPIGIRLAVIGIILSICSFILLIGYMAIVSSF